MTLVLGAVFLVGAFPMLWWAFSGPRLSSAVSRNLRSGLVEGTDMRAAVLSHSASERFVGPAMARLAELSRHLTPSGAIDRLEQRILLAGVPAGWTLERVLASKIVLAGAPATVLLLRLTLGGASISALALLVGTGAALLGWFLPSLLLLNLALKRQIEIRRQMPDTIDQVTLTVEAGLGFDAAVARAARAGRGALPQELLRTLQDIQAGMSRADALRRLADRTDVPELRRFIVAVLQSDSYGVPIAQVLRVQAAELRVKRRQFAEEKAMKLPVKILFPLVMCIFPAMFIVLLAPAGIRIMETLTNV